MEDAKLPEFSRRVLVLRFRFLLPLKGGLNEDVNDETQEKTRAEVRRRRTTTTGDNTYAFFPFVVSSKSDEIFALTTRMLWSVGETLRCLREESTQCYILVLSFYLLLYVCFIAARVGRFFLLSLFLTLSRRS